MQFFKTLLTVSGYVAIYYWVFYLNKLIFDTYEFSFGVNWVFIPSGLQLLLVLIAVENAAIGIAIATCLIGFNDYQIVGSTRHLMPRVSTQSVVLESSPA